MGIISCFIWGALRLIRVPFRSPEVAKASEASSTVHSPTDLHIAPHTSAGEQHSARLWSSRNVGTLKPSKHCYRKKYKEFNFALTIWLMLSRMEGQILEGLGAGWADSA